MKDSWVPLHVHSQYSILDSLCSITELVKLAKLQGVKGLALTDQGNLFGAIEFYKECKSTQIKPILGLHAFIAPESRKDKKKIGSLPSSFSIVLLAMNHQGYKNLCKLSSLGYLEGFYYTPRIDKELLSQYNDGLLCLTGQGDSAPAYYLKHNQIEEATAEIDWYSKTFGDRLYVEVQRHQSAEEFRGEYGEENWLEKLNRDYLDEQKRLEKWIVEIAEKKGIPCVAANQSHYLTRDDWRAHEILINVRSGTVCELWERDSQGNPKQKILNPKRDVKSTRELYFKSPEAMQLLFADRPEWLENTSKILDRCNLEIDFKTKFYPVFIPPVLENKAYTDEERSLGAQEYLRTLCEEAIPIRYTPERLAEVEKKYPGQDPLQVVKDRLKHELSVIFPMGMGDYLLIVHDFIAWAKKQGIPVGPGRGSGAGSIVLYLIEITDIEPLRFNLFFERFINPERISYPDIDVDICMDRRQEVIEYTVQKYGADKVAQIITFGTMKAKMAIRDVGRVLGVELAKVNTLAKLVPEDPTITLEKALEMDKDLSDLVSSDSDAKEIIEIARRLEGSVRNTGIHAAGIVVCARPLMDCIPVCNMKDSSMLVTQYSMKPVEAVGMLKIDFLGLKTLTSIQKTVQLVEKTAGIHLDWVNLPLDNPATFNLLNQGKTQGIFQMESGGMQDLAKQLHIDVFEEIIAVGALYRPGPMEMIPSFIQRKKGLEPIEFEHPMMKDILNETYGIMVYQEQVMQIASLMALYSLGEGDVLRRAMGKKDKHEMMKQKEKFIAGASKNGVDIALAAQIFDKMEKFASYGFNKSHATAYGYLTYTTAYLKSNYPKEWMASLMTCDLGDLTKVAKLIREAKTMNIAMLSPDINESSKEFTPTQAGIRFALTAVKGVGEAVVDSIIAERGAHGSFVSFIDFCKRLDTKKVGKKTVENLIEAGCFDSIHPARNQLLANIDTLFAKAHREHKEKTLGILHLFEAEEAKTDAELLEDPGIPSMDLEQILKKEKELLGFYLSGHPLDQFRSAMEELGVVSIEEIKDPRAVTVQMIAGTLETIEVKISAKNQRKFAILLISDGDDLLEVPMWSDLYDICSYILKEGQVVLAFIQAEPQGDTPKFSLKHMTSLAEATPEKIQEWKTLLTRLQSTMKTYSTNKKSPKAAKPGSKGTLRIDFDLSQVKLSHILLLKQLLSVSPGENPVELQFVHESQVLGVVQINSKWGVDLQKIDRPSMQAIPSLLKASIEESAV